MKFTKDETEVCRLLSEGFQPHEVGAQMGQKYWFGMQILNKLRDETGSKTYAHLVAKCYQLGILKVENER